MYEQSNTATIERQGGGVNSDAPASLESFLAQLRGVHRIGKGFEAFCPAHNDGAKSGRRSLLVNLDKKGNVWPKCWAGCTQRQVVEAIGWKMRDLYHADSIKDGTAREIEQYLYADEQGVRVALKLRLEKWTGGIREKTTPWKHWCPQKNDWVWGLGGNAKRCECPKVRVPLYRLQQIMEAVALDRLIVVAEGEKCVDRLVAEGFDSTTSGGAKTWNRQHARPLRGARVVVIPDQDDAGLAHAKAVVEDLRSWECQSLKLVRIPGLKEKEDVFDFFAKGGTAEELRELFEQAPELAKPEVGQEAPEPQKTAMTTDGDIDGLISQIALPEGYFLRGRLLMQVVVDAKGKAQEKVVSEAPLYITGRMKDINSSYEALCLSWRRPDRWHHLTADRDVALSDGKIQALAKQGFPVSSASAKSIVPYLEKLESTNYEALPAAKVTSHIGWQGKSGRMGFMWGRSLLLPEGGQAKIEIGETLPAQWAPTWIAFRGSSDGDGQLVDGYHSAGSMQAWTSALAAVSGFPRAMIALYSAFVPPLLPILTASNFVVDFANRTSTGKTTVLRVAGSVWGRPDERAPDSTIQSWDVTRVWLERASSVLSGVPMILDDTKRAKKPQDIADVIYTVCQGRGRGRGNVQGIDKTRSWRTVLLSTGEAPATSYTQDGGTRTRVLCIKGGPFGTDNAQTAAMIKKLTIELLFNYGHAGPAFVAWLMENRSSWKAIAEGHKKMIESYSAMSTSGATARLSESAAVLETTAQLVHQALDLPWRVPEKLRAILGSLISEGEDASGEERALQAATSWAFAHQQEFIGRHEERALYPSRAPAQGWAGRWDKGEDWPYIAFFPHVIRRLLNELGFMPDAIFAGWRELGWLALDADGKRYEKKVRIEGEAVRMICVTKKAVIEIEERHAA